jgi:N-acetylglutamate synthase-like GNAT family acetyltransferase
MTAERQTLPVVEPAAREHLPEIEAVLRSRRLPFDGAEEHLAGFIVALRDGHVVGTAGIEVYGEVGLVRSVAVELGSAGIGLGRLLVETLLHRARARDLRALYLLTTDAQDYFTRFGFDQVTRADLPAALSASTQLRGSCPTSAQAMRLMLRRG